MNAKGFAGLALLAVLAVVSGGCSHGRGVELGAFGSSLDADDVDNDVGFFPLAGLEIGLQRISIMAEARWLFLQTDVDQTKAELGNVTKANADGIGINVGVLYRF